METRAKIRRMHYVEGLSIKLISKELGLARNTVRSVLRSDTISKGYERKVVTSKLSEHESTLEDWLTIDKEMPKKQRPQITHYYERLQTLGYSGSYDAVCRFVRRWKGAQLQITSSYIPLYFASGEAYQFDWSEEVVELGGVIQSVKVGHFRLCHSRKFFVIAYLRERQEMLFDAHTKAFSFFNGVCQRGIYDNMKTAVTLIFKGKARIFNTRFLLDFG